MSLPSSVLHRRWNLLLLMVFVTSGAQGAVTIEFVATPSQVSTREKEILLYLRSTSGSLSNFNCHLNSLTPERGILLRWMRSSAPLPARSLRIPSNK